MGGWGCIKFGPVLKQPTAQDEAQLRNLLQYLLGTQQYSISLQPPRHWERAKNFDLLAFSAGSWQGACDFMIGSSLSLMGISLAASTMLQATTRTRAELDSVDMACTLACHTKSLLHELDLVQPMFLRVLVGGPLARQLGLSNKHRHMDLRCSLGQFQLSKVLSNKNLAEQLADNLRASDLHRLLAKLQIRHQPAEMLALSTRPGGEEVAFFPSSSSSFYIGVLSLQPSMSQLDLAQLEQIAMAELRRTACNTELLGEELEKPQEIPMLDSALCRELVEKIELEKAALQMNLDSLLRKSLRKEELTAERACPLMAQSFPAKPDEGWRASAYNCAALIQTAFRQLREQELDKKTNIPQLHLQLCPSTTQGGALKSSSRNQLRMTSSHRLSFTSLLSIFMILMVSSLILTSLSLPSSFRSKMQNELRRTCWDKEIEKQHELPNLLWEQELEELLVDKLLSNNAWSNQLRQNLSENEKNTKNDVKKLETNNEFHQSFENMILQKLVALLLEWHFARAAYPASWQRSLGKVQRSFAKDHLHEDLGRQSSSTPISKRTA